MRTYLSKISMKYGPDNNLNGLFTSGVEFDEIYLLGNGWVELVSDGATQLVPPDSVNWAVPGVELDEGVELEVVQ